MCGAMDIHNNLPLLTQYVNEGAVWTILKILLNNNIKAHDRDIITAATALKSVLQVVIASKLGTASEFIQVLAIALISIIPETLIHSLMSCASNELVIDVWFRNYRDSYCIWNDGTRKQLCSMCEQNQGRPFVIQEGFVYDECKAELVVNGVYVDIYNYEPR